MKNKIIFALDFARSETAYAFAKPLFPKLAMVKIGLELFSGEGPDCVLRFANEIPVFLDLKLHDIPKTVERAVKQVIVLGAKYITVHAAGGPEMIRRAVDMTQESSAQIVAVTALTSLDEEDLDAIAIDKSLSVEDYSLTLARMAYDQGVRAFVCSPREASFLRHLPEQVTLFCPGIRRTAGVDDQKRTASAAEAIRQGANYLVIGRPIKNSRDPQQTLDELNADVAITLSQPPK